MKNKYRTFTYDFTQNKLPTSLFDLNWETVKEIKSGVLITVTQIYKNNKYENLL